MKKRVLIAHPIIGPSGGGSAVAAWAVEALRETFEVSLLTLEPVDCAAVNRSFGTSLRDTDYTSYLAPLPYRWLLRALPTTGALLTGCALMRVAQDLDRRQRFDVLLGTWNEIDFGRPGIHYVHYPWTFLHRPKIERPWHRLPGLLRGYRNLCARLGRSSNEGLKRNLSLVNSAFIAKRVREVHGVDSVVVHPPVPGLFPDVDWEKRTRGFVALGRIIECKRWEMAVAILDEVRRRGQDVTFTLIGNREDEACHARLVALGATRPWFRMLNDVSRVELAATTANHRYGIHTMEDEHFGIGPAEMQRAGCIVFAHRSGGPVEIIGGEPRQLFDTVSEAADRIERVLTHPVEEEQLRLRTAARREQFSTGVFCAALHDVVAGFDARQAG